MTEPQRLGHFTLRREIGRGGMGVVHEAWDEKLERRVAVKVLPDAIASDPLRRARFLREARAAGALAHPSIATIHQVDEWDGKLAIVMELLAGESLRSRLAAGPLPVAEVERIAAAVASALAAAHRAGIVHRDLKPENVFVGDDAVKLLDFGIAKALATEVAEAPTGLTATGQVVGTAGYMAPEQVEGASSDPRVDVFAFGVVLFEMLAGSMPFDGATPMARAVAVMRDPPRDLRAVTADVPERLVAIVERCLEKEPGARFSNGGEIVRALGAATPSATSPTEASRASAASRVRIREGGGLSDGDAHAATEAAVALPRGVGPSADLDDAELLQPRSRRGVIVAIAAVAAVALVVVVASQPGRGKGVASSEGHGSAAPAVTPSRSSSAPASESRSAFPTALPCTLKGDAPASSCVQGTVGWCDMAWKEIACCGKGLVPMGSDGACACPPGGGLADEEVPPGCPVGKALHESNLPKMDAVLQTRQPEMMACYKRDLVGNARLEGTVVFSLRVAPNGRVFSARIARSTLPASTAQTCALDVLRGIQFPAPGGAAGFSFDFPMTFESGDETPAAASSR